MCKIKAQGFWAWAICLLAWPCDKPSSAQKKKKSIKSSFITFSVVKEAVSNIYPPKKIFLGKYQGSQVPDQSTSFSTRIWIINVMNSHN